MASAVSATSGSLSGSASGPQVRASDQPVLREDLQAAKKIERFDIPLDSLKRMFEKPAAEYTVSACFNFTGTEFPNICTLKCHFFFSR